MLFRKKPPPLSEWFIVKFDDESIHWQVEPPDGTPWTAEVRWSNITRICFLAADIYQSDEIHIFTNERPESYVVPTEAGGGDAVWDEVLNRKLFDADLALEAIRCSSESLFCWPPADDGPA